jgi:hypothetical protein
VAGWHNCAVRDLRGDWQNRGRRRQSPWQQLSAYPGGRSNPVHGAHSFFFGWSSLVPPYTVLSCAQLCSSFQRRGMGSGQTARPEASARHKRTRGDAFSLQRAMSSRGASLSLPACLLADGFACGCGGTARHGARVTDTSRDKT